MKTSRYATSRQKACQQCSEAKAKCDRKPEGCSRCVSRSIFCNYPRAVHPRGPVKAVEVHSSERQVESFSSLEEVPLIENIITTQYHDLPLRDISVASTGTSVSTVNGDRHSEDHLVTMQRPLHDHTQLTPGESHDPEALDFLNLDLICPIAAEDIRNRWLNAFIPVPGQKVKQYPTSVSGFIYRILKSYAAVAVNGRGVPPFIHQMQLTAFTNNSPLSICLSLARICQNPLQGSENVAVDVLQREMNSTYELRGTYDDLSLLAAYQAYLLYAMILFFQLNQGSNPFLRQAMMNLQDLACASSRGGLMCSAERHNARPKWEAWIVAEAKRRTLYTMYLFDSVLSSEDGLPTFLGTELTGLPAPSNKPLWQAKSRYQWEVQYNIFLADWTEPGLCIDELWPIPLNLDALGVAKRRKRVDRWLESLDEYGTMMYAVTNCTHGG